MIHYIIAAGIGAFLGSQSKKSKKSYAEGGLLRVLKDSGFGHYKGTPENEYTHNRGHIVAVVTKDSVHLSNYTPNTHRFLGSTIFDNPKKLAEYFDKNQIYAKGGEVKFRKLAKSKNFDIVTPDGRFEIEMGAFGMPKSIIIDGHRRDINRNPLAIKYRTEIQEYLDKN